jgi:hypothetical protein
MHLRAGPVRPPPELCLDVSLQQRRRAPHQSNWEARFWNRPDVGLFVSRSTVRDSSQGRGGSRSPLQVRPMEEGRKSSLSYRPAALPKPFVPSDCASIGIIAAPLSESFFVKRRS